MGREEEENVLNALGENSGKVDRSRTDGAVQSGLIEQKKVSNRASLSFYVDLTHFLTTG